MKNINLQNYTKNDLISVIANMHDWIKKWDDYADATDAPKLNAIGSECENYCCDKNNWKLPEV